MESYQALALSNVFFRLAPEMILALVACILFVGGTWKASRELWGTLSLVGLIAAAFLSVYRPGDPQMDDMADVWLYANPVLIDPLTTLVRWLALGGGALLVLLSWDEVPEDQSADFNACLLLIVAGTSLTAAANDLVAMFLALEIVSIPTYVLLYLPRHDKEAQEAALKYFLLSVFSSAILLFGFSYLYGLVGSTNISVLHHTLHHGDRVVPAIAQIAVITVVAGLAFRVTAVPFHFYAPDVYQGTATAAAALLAYLPKVVGFVALVRILGFVLPAGVGDPAVLLGADLSNHVPILFWFLAAVTMLVGNVLALWQDNVKRLLAYSSVAHAGYMLMALASAPYLGRVQDGPDGIQSLLFYLPAYGAMTIGAFAVISYLNNGGQKVETVDDLSGLGTTRPLVAVFFAIFLFSLIGIPFTAGFTAKFLVFFGTMAVEDHVWLFRILTLFAGINAAIGGWYYLRIIAIMFLHSSLAPDQPRRSSWTGLAALSICVILTVGLSIPPGSNWLLNAANYYAIPAR